MNIAKDRILRVSCIVCCIGLLFSGCSADIDITSASRNCQTWNWLEYFCRWIGDIPVVGWIYSLPDIDLWFMRHHFSWIILHRSILTHNALLPFMLKDVPLVNKCVSFLIGIHLFADMFPQSWQGLAYIHIPLLGNLVWIPLDGDIIPVLFSFCWLGLNVLICLAVFTGNFQKMSQEQQEFENMKETRER